MSLSELLQRAIAEGATDVHLELHQEPYFRLGNELQQLMEPIMVSLMGIGVAILVIAVMLPMFNAVTAMQHV